LSGYRQRDPEVIESDVVRFSRSWLGRILLLLLCIQLTHSKAAGQPGWSVIKKFQTPIGCGYFFSKDTGFVGSGIRIVTGDPISIYRTNDGGATWITCKTPVSEYGAVTSISMQTRALGYASIFGLQGGQTLWRTNDSGATWVDISPLAGGFGTCAYSTPYTITLTQWYAIGGSSKDGGLTYGQTFVDGGPENWSNGIDFTDSLHGVVTLGPVVFPAQNTSYYTQDGGLTWIASPSLGESWSVYGLKGTLTFFAGGEGPGAVPNPSHSILRSNDGGANWSTIYTFPDNRLSLTGHLAGKGQTLYVQSDTGDMVAQRGLYRSDDLGRNWHYVGGPCNSRDTRFIVTGCSGEVVYAFDMFGNIWKTTGGGDGTLIDGDPTEAILSISPDTLNIRTLGCSDSAKFQISSLACPTIHFDSVRIAIDSDVTFSQLPADTALHQNDAIPISVVFTPRDTGTKIEKLRVFCHTGSRVFIDTVLLNLRSTGGETLVLPPDSLALSQSDCNAVQDSVNLVSISCYPFVIDSVSFGDSAFSSPAIFPYLLAGNSGVLPVNYHADSNGSHSSFVRLHAHSGLETFDTTVAISGSTVLPTPQLSVAPDTLKYGTKYCIPTVDSFTFANPNCYTIVIDSVVSTGVFFVDTSQNGLKLEPGKSATAVVTFSPADSGLARGTVLVYGHSGGGRFIDSSMLVGSNSSLPTSVHLSTVLVSLSSVDCSLSQDSLVFANQGCAQVKIDSIVSFDKEVTVQVTNMPTLNGGDSTSILVQFIPDSSGTHVGLLHIYGQIGLRNFDTVISCSATSSLSTTPFRLSGDSVNLWTSYCQPVQKPFWVYNGTCTALVIDSVYLLNDSLQEFSFDTSGATLVRSLDSGQVSVNFSPSERGQRFGSMKLFLHCGERAFDTLLALSGKNVTAPEPYLAPIATGKASDTVSIAVMLLPTTDTFTIRHVDFHIGLNTDLITPQSVQTKGSLSEKAANILLTTEPPGGIHFSEDLPQPITKDSDLTKPLVIFRAPIYLTKALSTPVIIDSFATTVTGLEPLCSLPEQTFTSYMACGDSTIRTLMLGNPLQLRIVSLRPNPVSSNAQLQISYNVAADAESPELAIVDENGRIVQSTKDCPGTQGTHTLSLSTPQASGKYQLILRNSSSSDAMKFLIVK
jgi:photosystem II stability/assembly factor-like uncharacterized protein